MMAKVELSLSAATLDQQNYAENDQLIAYTKQSPDGANIILVVVNLDPVQTQSGWVHLPLRELGIDPGMSFLAHDLVNERTATWTGEWNFVELDPAVMPAHIFRIERRQREHDVGDYS